VRGEVRGREAGVLIGWVASARNDVITHVEMQPRGKDYASATALHTIGYALKVILYATSLSRNVRSIISVLGFAVFTSHSSQSISCIRRGNLSVLQVRTIQEMG
jgi:hypothetical protein